MDQKPSREEAEEAVRTILRYLGQDSQREGLFETPGRVIRALKDSTCGAQQDPGRHLLKIFQEVSHYSGHVILKDIHFESLCEHHLAPIVGHVHIGYIPNGFVVGISKIARVVYDFSKRLQIQEKMTEEIALCLSNGLKAHGVGVIIEATHCCMTTRGVCQRQSKMITHSFKGASFSSKELREEFLHAVK